MDYEGNRRFERTAFRVKGFVSCENGECAVNVINISMKGVLISANQTLALTPEGSYPLRISLPHSDISIVTQATLIHKSDGQYGFRFNSVEADGMIHLRRLLELNSESGENIDRELSFLVD